MTNLMISQKRGGLKGSSFEWGTWLSYTIGTFIHRI